MVSLPPSWLKETPLRFEEIARYHASPLIVHLPALADDGSPEVLAPEKYDLPQNEKDEGQSMKNYQWQHLASESGIYNERNTFPRALLWRVVNGGTLTIHNIDSVRPRTVPRNRPLTALHFRFPFKIRPHCIGFTEVESTTVLSVLTEECVLYTIPLSERVLSGQDRRVESITDGIKAHRPLFLQARFGQGKMALDLPHFMYVLPNSEKILFAMQDGTQYQYNPYDYSVMRFTGDATLRKTLKTWIPTWSGHNPTYPAHIVISCVASTKHSLLFTVSADQRLRMWSLDRSQFIKEYDLAESPAIAGRLLGQPPAHLLALDDTQDHGEFLFYLVTYTSIEDGQFIVWAGEHTHGAFSNLVQLQAFKPEIPEGTRGIWTISDFFLAEAKTISESHGVVVQNTYTRSLRLWIVWKSYVSSVLQYTDIRESPQWITIMSHDADQIDEVENSVESWSNRITAPGRFSDAVIQTALQIFWDRMYSPEQHSNIFLSTRTVRKESLDEVVGRKQKLGINQRTGQLDFEKYRQDLSIEFSQFEATCKELSKAGDEFRQLSFDRVTGEAIMVRADGIVTIRNLLAAEILHWGATGTDGQFEDVLHGDMIQGSLYGDFRDKNIRSGVATLARAAYKFRSTIIGGNIGDITAGLVEEVMSESNFSLEDRLWAFYDKYFSDESVDRTGLEEVRSALSSIADIPATLRTLLDILSTDICQDDTVVPLAHLTALWGEIITVGIRDAVSTRWVLLRDFALFAAWLYSTEEQLVDPAHKRVVEGYWSDCLRAFKGVNMLRHLVMTEVAHLTDRKSPEEVVSGSMEEMHLDDTVDVVHLPPRTNALRYLVESTLDSSGVGINFVSFVPPMSLSLAVASSLTQINYADGYSGMAIRIVSYLLRLGSNIEAARFARYLPNSPVGGYVWGHVLLQKEDWEKAGAWFSRVAPILAKSGRVVDFECAKPILRDNEVDHIGKGLFQYYEHIARLFDKKHAHSQTIYYCERALALAYEVSSEAKDSVLVLLFNNSINVASYDDAYTSMTRLNNYEMFVTYPSGPNPSQRGSLEILIVAMVEHGQASRLCSYPFGALQDSVDEILLRRAEEVVDVRPFPNYHKVLFSWRIRQGDFQGAACVMYQRVQLLKNTSNLEMDVNYETLEISEAYLAIINALSCVAEKNAWIFVYNVFESESPSTKRIKTDNEGTRVRTCLCLEDVRKEYAAELERQQGILGKVADEFGLDGFDM